MPANISGELNRQKLLSIAISPIDRGVYSGYYVVCRGRPSPGHAAGYTEAVGRFDGGCPVGTARGN